MSCCWTRSSRRPWTRCGGRWISSPPSISAPMSNSPSWGPVERATTSKTASPRFERSRLSEIISEAKIRKLEADYLEVAKAGSAVAIQAVKDFFDGANDEHPLGPASPPRGRAEPLAGAVRFRRRARIGGRCRRRIAPTCCPSIARPGSAMAWTMKERFGRRSSWF